METTPRLNEMLAAHHQGRADVVNVDLPTVKLVIFVLEDDWFAFYGEQIKEILAHSAVFFLPGCPPSLEGVINVRGDIESVLNLRSLWGYPPTPQPKASRILLAQGEQIRSGIRVDRVEEVTDIIEDSIQAPPHAAPEHLRPLLLGQFSMGSQVVSLLDVDRLFAQNLATPEPAHGRV